jgi:ADP-L-glycero-D-manno-heptose 6-epimerase
MIVVTGGAGFIGSVLIWKLNSMGISDILVVDETDISDRKANLANKKVADYLDKDAFMDGLKRGTLSGKVEAILHMGACSSTLVQDAAYFSKNNFQYTRDLAIWCVNNGAIFLYASSAATYGDGALGYSDEDESTLSLKPLNLYGKSKQDFDVWALKNNYLNKITGFKFFNVYGPNEYHKGEMRSVIAKSFDEVVREKKIRLFKSYKPEYGDGEQKRDFIYVKDAAEVVAFFLEHPEKTGIFNVGTGSARTWNELADGLFKALRLPLSIEYIEMPEILRPRYQYFTEADTRKLRNAGYAKEFTLLAHGIRDYCGFLKDRSIL